MTKLRCAIYTRKSSDEGLEQSFNSLDAQREACAAYIVSQKSEGWILNPAYYDDGGISGGTMERPALQRLLADIGTGKIDIVVVYKVDRLTRSLADFARIVEAFDAKGVSFVSVTQAFNTTTSMGRLRTSPSGKVTGGVPFGRGPLFIMLRNRIYRGEINHKGTLYPGLHEAIIDAETFERVQQLLDTNSHRKGKRVQQQDDDPSPLMGLLYDDKGNRLTPVHGRNRRGRLYRYYIQPGLQTGQQRGVSKSMRRVPAPVIEGFVMGKLPDLMVLPAMQW